MVKNHYSMIISGSQSALNKLSQDAGRLAAFTTAHNEAQDLDELSSLLESRPEAQMFQLARIEYQHSLYSAAFAQYRQAHISLRLFIELSLCSILFSAHEIETRLWLKGQKDINWNAISSNETGVFSKNFVGAFFEEMKDHCSQYLAIATRLYRECSEYVHGNRLSYDGIDGSIEYNKEIFDVWVDRADSARLVVKFAFLSRYLPYASQDAKDKITDMALQDFGTLAPIQDIFAKANANE